MAVNSNIFKTLVSGVETIGIAIGLSAGVADANKIIQTDANGLIDPSFFPASFDVVTRTYEASVNLDANDLVNIFDDAGTFKVRKADSSLAQEANGFILDTVTATNNVTVYLVGVLPGFTGLSEGFVQLTTNGDGTQTYFNPADGEIYQVLGYALSATEIRFEYNSPTVIDIA